MDRLFVVNKPIFISSNNYMNYVKRKYNTKKVGFSGTLDPFATGCLIVATGKFTKLFQFLNKTPKSYRATLWLGASSKSLDIENIIDIKDVPELSLEQVQEALTSLKGVIRYLPPKYSAKKINGQRAYDLARKEQDIALKEVESTIYDIKFLHYTHPFITFEVRVSEGTYVRSIAEILGEKFNLPATLSSLHRIHEGAFFYENEKPLNPYEYLKIPRNKFLGEDEVLELGKKIDSSYFEKKENGEYLVETKNFYSIIKIENNQVKYLLNRLPKEYK